MLFSGIDVEVEDGDDLSFLFIPSSFNLLSVEFDLRASIRHLASSPMLLSVQRNEEMDERDFLLRPFPTTQIEFFNRRVELDALCYRLDPFVPNLVVLKERKKDS